MPINHSKSSFYLVPDGTVYEGDEPPSGSTVLVGPGGTIDDHLAVKHELADRLKGEGEPGVMRDPAGNPIIIRDGRAVAARVLGDDDPEKVAVMEAAAKEDEAAKAESDVMAKAESDKSAELAEAHAELDAEHAEEAAAKLEADKPADAPKVVDKPADAPKSGLKVDMDKAGDRPAALHETSKPATAKTTQSKK